jgi:hypothetical protein
MIQIAIIETSKAERFMKALCNHFVRKNPARYEGDKGYIEFGDGKCEITASFQDGSIYPSIVWRSCQTRLGNC